MGTAVFRTQALSMPAGVEALCFNVLGASIGSTACHGVIKHATMPWPLSCCHAARGAHISTMQLVIYFPHSFGITKLNTTCSIDQWTSLQPQDALNGFQSKKKSLHSTKEHPLKAQAHETCHPVCTLSTNMQKASQSFDDSRGSLP